MKEIREVLQKYDESFVRESLGSVESINAFSLTFYKDVAEIYDVITRVKC